MYTILLYHRSGLITYLSIPNLDVFLVEYLFKAIITSFNFPNKTLEKPYTILDEIFDDRLNYKCIHKRDV